MKKSFCGQGSGGGLGWRVLERGVGRGGVDVLHSGGGMLCLIGAMPDADPLEWADREAGHCYLAVRGSPAFRKRTTILFGGLGRPRVARTFNAASFAVGRP